MTLNQVLKGIMWTLELIKSSYILSKNKEVRFYYKLKQTIEITQFLLLPRLLL